MRSTTDIEHLREALASSKQIEAALSERLREREFILAGIEALQAVDDPVALLPRAFDVLRQAVDFDVALVLEPSDGAFVCTASTDPAAVGAKFPGGGFFQRVATGKAAVAPDSGRVPGWAACRDYPAPAGGGVFAPIAVDGGFGLLVLGAAEHGRYSARDGAMVSRLGLIVSQSLATAQRRRLSEAARAAEAERRAAIEASEAKSRFLANMSHEIRTPLNGVGAVAEMLAQTPLAPRQREMVDLIVQSSRMLEGLLNDVLDFAKIEEGRLNIECAPFDLAASLTSVLDLFAAKADEKGLTFSAQISPLAAGEFLGDSLRIRQVVSNLVSNAVKFTEHGDVVVQVDVLDGADADTVRVVVSDTGCGFSEDMSKRLFRRFEQGDDSITKQFGGAGLGLTISRSLARMMGGDIVFRSSPGEGSTFEATFQARRVASATAEQPLGAEAAQADGPLRVLVVEDNANNRKIAAMILEMIGAQAVYVENGAEALDAFAPGRFDIILMDLQMPVMDGLTATRRIRAREVAENARPLPILALSANAMNHHVEEAIEAGATGHVAKPISPKALIEAIQASVLSLGVEGQA